jgi:hypothetical protein
VVSTYPLKTQEKISASYSKDEEERKKCQVKVLLETTYHSLADYKIQQDSTLHT